MNLEKLRIAINRGRIEWRKHVLQRLAERGIKQKDILDVLLTGTIIEEYVDDKPSLNIFENDFRKRKRND